MAIRNVRGPGYRPGRQGTLGRAREAERADRTEAVGDALEQKRRAPEPEWIPPLDPEAELDARRGKQVELQLDGVVRQAEIEARFALQQGEPGQGSSQHPVARQLPIDPAVGRLMQMLDAQQPVAAPEPPLEETVVSAQPFADDEATEPAAATAIELPSTEAVDDSPTSLLDQLYAAEEAFLLSAGVQGQRELIAGLEPSTEAETGWELSRSPAATSQPGWDQATRWRLGVQP